MGMKMKKTLLTLVIITSVVTVVSTGCALTGNVAKVEWIGTGPVYGHLTVELVPTDNAEANVIYIVELWEKGKLRDDTEYVSWSQPELNVHTVKSVNFPLTWEEFNAYEYSTEDLGHIFSVKVHR
jgi:hypothetical protein